MAEFDKFKLNIGTQAPYFSLPGTDGIHHQLEDFSGSRLLLVVFSCNHCPYAQAWEGRLISIARDYSNKGLATAMINSNETENYPDDRFEKMVERARYKEYPFPYLRDDSQDVARAYGALVTPHLFLFDSSRRLIFQGLVDDNHKEPQNVKRHYLKDAIEAALSGRDPNPATTSVVGCSVKWKL